MTLPSVSVVVPNYNHARFLPDALNAILQQSVQPLEIILIDDASTDNSLEIAQEFQKLFPLIRPLRNETNKGVIYNLNLGLELSKGDFVYCGAADDRTMPGLFEKSLALLAQYPKAGLCSSLSLLFDETGKDLGLFPSRKILSESGYISPERGRAAMMDGSFWIMGNTAVYQRQAVIDAGGFRPELGPFTDGFLQRVIALRHGVCFVPEPLAAWRRMEEGYASRSASDMRRSAEIMEHASRLMQTTYQDIFPPEYARKLRREWQSWTVQQAWDSATKPLGKYVSDLSALCPSKSPLDSCFCWGMRLLVWSLKVMARLFIFARFRFSIRWVLEKLRLVKKAE